MNTNNPRSSESSNNPSAPLTPNDGPPIDSGQALADRLTAVDGADEDIAMVIALNWQKLVGVLIVVLIGFWIYGEYRSTTAKKAGESAERFDQMRLAYTDFLNPPEPVKAADANTPEKDSTNEAQPTQSEEEKKAQLLALENTLGERVRFLENSSDQNIYAQTAPLYRASAAIGEGKLADAKAILQKFDIQQPPAAPVVGAEIDGDGFINDLASMLYARVLLAQGPESRAEFRSYLTSLAVNARFVNVEALILLYRAAEDETQRTEAKVVAAKLAVLRPELAESIRQEYGAMGAKVE